MKSPSRRYFKRWLKRAQSNRWTSYFRRRTSSRFARAIALAVAAYVHLGRNAHAEEAPAVMPEVLVTGQGSAYQAQKISSPKYTEPLRSVPQSVTVVPQAVMEEQGATSLRDVLRNVPGISIQAGEGGVPAGDNLSIRGFNARTDFFIDGLRDFGGYSRDPFNSEQVEVFKGPSSSLAGRGSTGGAINMVTKKPGAVPLREASLGVGAADYQRATLDVNQPINDAVAVRMNALWHDAGVPGIDDVHNQRWAAAPYISFGLNGPTRVDLGYFHMRQDNLPSYGIPWVTASQTALLASRDQVAPVDYSNFYGLTNRDYEKIDTDIADGIASHSFNDAISLSNHVRYGRTSRDSVITAPRFANDSTVTINRQLQSRDMNDTIIANQTDVTTKFKTAGIGHTLVTGVEFDRETSVNYARSGPASTTNLYNPNPGDAYAGPIVRTGARTEADADSIGLYAFDTINLGEKWEVPVSLRWDQFDVDTVSVSTNGVSTPLGRTDDMTSWRAGVVFKPVPTGSVYAAYGTSFNPSAEGLTLTAATASLEPEKSRSYELGTKWDILNKLMSLTAAIFRTEKTNARTPGVNPGDPPTVLEGKQRVDGFELGASGSLTDRWMLFSGYTYLQSRISESNTAAEVGKELTNTPKHSLSVWNTYLFPCKLQIGGGAQYVDSRFGNTTNTRRVDDYWLFDAMASYPLQENLTLRVNVTNLADEKYIDRVGGGHIIPGAGRAVTVTTDLKF